LQQKSLLLKKKFITSNIIIENLGLSNLSDIIFLRQFKESSSSTFNKINNNSLYYKKKNQILYSNKDKNLYQKIKVKVVSLQSYLNKKKIKKIDLLKIDTEG
jgi:FkbM family methyltransferase